MKQFIVTIFLSVAFSAILNAAQRKIAYDRGGKISLPTSMVPIQIVDGAWPEISPAGTRVAFRTPVATGLWPVQIGRAGIPLPAASRDSEKRRARSAAPPSTTAHRAVALAQ
jgi:hypothetical protein